MAELSIKGKKIEEVRRMDGESFTIGRAAENDLALDDPAVSNKHCVIQMAGDDVKIVDFNSSNGTIVNGKRIDDSCVLNNGSKVDVGSARITFFSETAPGPRLVVDGPDMAGTTLVLGKKALAIGRMDSNDLVLPHSGVSNFHAQITFADEGYRFQDLGSTNGSTVNGDFVTALALSKGDRIEMGPYTLTLQWIGKGPRPGPAASPAVSSAPPREIQRTGSGVITAAAVIAGILVFLVLVEIIVRRMSESTGPRVESGLNLLIGNVSFEKTIVQGRTPPGWQVKSDVRSTVRLIQTEARNGVSSLEIGTEPGKAMDSVVSCVYAEDIPVDRTRGYKGTFWVRTRERSGLCLAGLEWVDMPSGQIVGEDFGRAIAGCGDWTRVTVGGIPTEEADRVRLRFVTYGGQGTLYVDDAALYEVGQGKVGTVRYKYIIGDYRITMDPRGLLSLRSDDALLIRRSEFVVNMGGVDTGQSLAALAGGYPVMDESGFTVRGKLCDLSSGRWIKFESVVSARGASADLDCRVWPEEGGANPASLRIDLFIPSSVLREGGLRTISGGRTVVRESTFTESSIDQIEVGLSGKAVSMRVSSFDTVVLKDAGRRGLKLTLSKSVRGVPVGGSADVSLVITPN